jgi:hypothetical protein
LVDDCGTTLKCSWILMLLLEAMLFNRWSVVDFLDLKLLERTYIINYYNGALVSKHKTKLQVNSYFSMFIWSSHKLTLFRTPFIILKFFQRNRTAILYKFTLLMQKLIFYNILFSFLFSFYSKALTKALNTQF